MSSSRLNFTSHYLKWVKSPSDVILLTLGFHSVLGSSGWRHCSVLPGWEPVVGDEPQSTYIILDFEARAEVSFASMIFCH